MAGGIDHTYQYPFPSSIETSNKGSHLTLATSSEDLSAPYFFDGTVLAPRLLGELLLCLSKIVRTHYFIPAPGELDPVLTSSESMLRLEGFSGCCGVYVRADLPAQMFETERMHGGTTNVDFNVPMRQALGRLRDHQRVRFSVGRAGVVLNQDDQEVVEKKVKLPLRWLKSFSEVQAYQSRLQLAHQISAADALRFVRSLPKKVTYTPNYVIAQGNGLRLTHRPRPSATTFFGAHRLQDIEPMIRYCKQMQIWADNDSGVSGWSLLFEHGARLFLALSPGTARGFSGEGQLLEHLARPTDERALAAVRAQLQWQDRLDTAQVALDTQLSANAVNDALVILGSRGLAGYDVNAGTYFHRELPFDIDKVEQLQPRLKQARKLISNRAVVHLGQGEYQVDTNTTTHLVRLGEQDTCTCPWYAKHTQYRGPCKHILAAQITENAHEAAE